MKAVDVDVDVFDRPGGKFGVIHQRNSRLATWKMGSIEDDDVYYVVCDRAGQELSPRIFSKVQVELLFAWCDSWCDRLGARGDGL